MLRSALPLLALAVLLLTGCDPAVQARYQPTSVDDVFGAFARTGGVDAEVYELPAQPPMLSADDLIERPCGRPGLRMKPIALVAMHHDPRRVVRNEPTLMVASFEPPLPSPPPMPRHRIASWQQHNIVGAKEPIASPPYSPALDPGRSIHRNEPRSMGSYRRDDYSWCEPAANLR